MANTAGDYASASTELGAILLGDLPDLPPGDVCTAASELRYMRTPRARLVWTHPGWAALCRWITRTIPDCDPIVPAIHAMRQTLEVRSNPPAVHGVARRVLAVARKSPADRCRGEVSLDWDPPDLGPTTQPGCESLASEAASLFRVCAIFPPPAAWLTISPSLDIATDWLDRFAAHSGLTGRALLARARDSERMSSEWRLRRYLQGPTGRPLVALLLGGDQWGRAARRACGQEAGLVFWALEMRRARRGGEPDPVPAAPVVRAWSTTVRLIENATGTQNAPDHDVRRTVAA
jgi:hypothetical protein